MILTKEYKANYREIKWKPLKPSAQRQRQENIAPYVISDTMPETLHHAANRISTSKSEFRKWTKRAGCEEVGNSAFPKREPYKPLPVGPDLKRALEELHSRG